jgi:(1->4)-alpha-D-glucan 1-alpha-D-glucosylmutase
MHIPSATYRVQFNSSFMFKDARAIVEYLADLGISHLYASPIFQARRGSPHGYDVVDPNRLNPELGSTAEFEELAGTMRDRSIGWLQDIVPNHMAFAFENRWLMDILENGPSSPFYDFFDVLWDHPYANLKGKLLAPFLGGRFAECHRKGEIRLGYDAEGFHVSYYELKLPVKAASYVHLLSPLYKNIQSRLDEENLDYISFFECLDVIEALSVHDNGIDRKDRQEKIANVKSTLWNLYRSNSAIRQGIDRMTLLNGDRDNLDRLLSDQFFRLSFWQTSADEINYRRFFDINELISVRQNKLEVFEQTHSLIFSLVDRGIVDGLRIDHIDGLSDPLQYLRNLRNASPNAYIVAEKILEAEEMLSEDWPVQGTTGYDFGSWLNRLFCREDSEDRFRTIYSRFAGVTESFENIAYAAKRRILETVFAGDLDNLARAVKKISVRTAEGVDLSLRRLQEALAELCSRFPVYRTYIDKEGGSAADRRYIGAAIELSAIHRPHLQDEFLFLQKLLNGELGLDDAHLQAIDRFQLLTAPLMAKGFEDTALYVYGRLISLNEVGGDPARFGCSVEAFHDFISRRMKPFPHTMNGTGTHDSKRGEDVRARLDVLSELPDAWEENLSRWNRLNRGRKTRIEGKRFPDRNEEYFLYQTLIGAFPFEESERPNFTDRMKAYVIKAAREAKVYTSWLRPDQTHEAAISGFVEKMLNPSEKNRFMAEFRDFHEKVAAYGIFNSLSQALIKLTVPGVPDVYQGTELFDFSLVDPDNRRPVDFQSRIALLDEIDERLKNDRPGLIGSLVDTRTGGRIKFFLTALSLRARNRHLPLFQDGAYIPLIVEGLRKENLLVFARSFEDSWSITMAPRFLTKLIPPDALPFGREVWQDTAVLLPAHARCSWRDIFTDRVIPAGDTICVGDVLDSFPVSLLIGEK